MSNPTAMRQMDIGRDLGAGSNTTDLRFHSDK
jgi:hypothetical protein